MADVSMPRLSDSMEEGTILKWLKSDGDAVAAGEDLVEIETDKATMTYASDDEGTLEIVADEGSSHPVGAVIARVGAASERPTASEQESAPAPAPETPAPVPAITVATSSQATPLARRVASEHQIDLQSVEGTGPRGRITRADVLAAAGISEPPMIPAARAQIPVAPEVVS